MLADPDFGCSGRINLLLGVDIYTNALLHGWRSGPTGSPVAFETIFGWVLATPIPHLTLPLIMCLYTALNDDDVLRRFWEIEELLPKTKIHCPLKNKVS